MKYVEKRMYYGNRTYLWTSMDQWTYGLSRPYGQYVFINDVDISGAGRILVQGRGEHLRESASWAPRMPEKFRKFSKKFLNKIAKNALF